MFGCLIPETFTRNLRARAEKNVCAIKRLSMFVQTIAVDQHLNEIVQVMVKDFISINVTVVE